MPIFAPKLCIHTIIDVKIEEPKLLRYHSQSGDKCQVWLRAWGHVTRDTGQPGPDCIHDNGNGGHDKDASLIRGA